MVKQVGYNWHNDFVQCSENVGCFYKSGKCFNPHHMNVKDYEKHFKAKMSLRTVKKFKKTIDHYLPDDNVLYSIIEQTKFFKKRETETIVKKWEENWMSGEWAEAIAKADEVMVKQEYHSLIKIMLNYVRLFIHSEAKYATQDYVKAVMLQEYVGDVFKEEHFKVLTSPWLAGKNAEEPHFWKYSHRHLSVPTQPLTDISAMLVEETVTSVEPVKDLTAIEDTQPIFENDDDFIKVLNTTGETPRWVESFWNPEKENVTEETSAEEDAFVEEEVFVEEENEVVMKENIIHKMSKPINKVADYLGYNSFQISHKENVIVEHDVLHREQDFTTEDIVLPNFYEKKEETVTDLVKNVVDRQKTILPDDVAEEAIVKEEDKTLQVIEESPTVEDTNISVPAVGEKSLEEVPEHLRDFIKTIYFR